jgi:O-antigen/teichoic acid export membrane protein
MEPDAKSTQAKGAGACSGNRGAANSYVKLSGRPVLHNLLAVGSAEAATRIAQLVALAVIAQRLGPHGFGVIGTGWAFYNLAIPFAQQSPELVGIRALARHRDRLSLIGETVAIKSMLALAAFALCVTATGVLYHGDPALERQIVVQSMVLLGFVLSFGWVFQAFRHFEIQAGLRVLRATASTTLLALALWYIRNPLMAPLADLTACMVTAGLEFLMVAGWLKGQGEVLLTDLLTTSIRTCRQALGSHGASAARLGLASFSAALSWWGCIPLARFFISTSEVGILAAVVRLVFILNGGFLLGIQLFYPILAENLAAGGQKGKDIGANLVCCVAVAAVLAYIPILLFGERLMGLLFGASFAEGGACLRLMGLITVAGPVGAVYGYALLAAGRDREFVQVITVGAAATIVADCLGFLSSASALGAAGAVPVFFAEMLAGAVLCRRAGLVASKPFAFRRFRPVQVLALLRAR